MNIPIGSGKLELNSRLRFQTDSNGSTSTVCLELLSSFSMVGETVVDSSTSEIILVEVSLCVNKEGMLDPSEVCDEFVRVIPSGVDAAVVSLFSVVDVTAVAVAIVAPRFKVGSISSLEDLEVGLAICGAGPAVQFERNDGTAVGSRMITSLLLS